MIFYKELGNAGRLCNQFFEIAATVALAEENNDIAVFPEWNYNRYFEIGIKTDKDLIFDIKSNFHEPSFNYRKIPYTEGMNLNGYFQSEKYFMNSKDKIRSIFKLKSEYENDLRNKWKNQLKNSVSIHVRRTDYAQSESIGGIHICPTLNYFDSALRYIESFYKIDNILIFSDDIEWCKENFKDSRCIFPEGDEVDDLFLMSFCEHNITTNSTYSWWASWLNKNENKIVTVPKSWFNRHPSFSADLYRDDMKIFEN